MVYFREGNYEMISKSILPMLNNLSGLILSIEKLNDSLLMNKDFNQNKNFLNYIQHFSSGRYFHFRSQGYLEALLQTNVFSKENLCFWLNNLVFPAHSHFKEAIIAFDLAQKELSSLNNSDFQKLTYLLTEFRRVGNGIMDSIKQYNISCT